jgi:hypothetical protein
MRAQRFPLIAVECLIAAETGQRSLLPQH